MLLKLLKHEFKTNRTTFILLYVSIIVLSILLSFSEKFISASSNFFPVSGVLAFLFVFAMMGLFIFCCVYIVMSFLKSMFRKPGYLTQTLPISTAMHLTSKLIMATFWIIISAIVGVITVIILTPDFFETFSKMWKEMSFYGFDVTFWLAVLMLFVSIFESILMVYLCITITHTKYIKSHRGIIGVALFAVINIILSYIKGFISPTSPTSMFMGVSDTAVVRYVDDINSYLAEMIVPTIIMSVIICIICFIGVCYLNDKKVELD